MTRLLAILNFTQRRRGKGEQEDYRITVARPFYG